jgi:hypothetical protein
MHVVRTHHLQNAAYRKKTTSFFLFDWHEFFSAGTLRSSMMAKSQIVLVHGAFHSPYHMEPLASLLRASPYNYTVRVPQLPSSAEKSPTQSFEADVATIKTTIEEAALDGDFPDIVPVFHSYASSPGFDAIASLRPEVKKQIKRVVLIAAFVLPKGSSLTSNTNGEVAPWAERRVRPESPSSESSHCVTSKLIRRNVQDELVVVPDPIPTFYADVPASLAETCAAHITPHSYEAISHPAQYEGWRDVPVTYILCTNDAAVVTEWVQRPAIALLQEHGEKGLEVVELESSHSPFLSQAEKCAEVIGHAMGPA